MLKLCGSVNNLLHWLFRLIDIANACIVKTVPDPGDACIPENTARAGFSVFCVTDVFFPNELTVILMNRVCFLTWERAKSRHDRVRLKEQGSKIKYIFLNNKFFLKTGHSGAETLVAREEVFVIISALFEQIKMRKGK